MKRCLLPRKNRSLPDPAGMTGFPVLIDSAFTEGIPLGCIVCQGSAGRDVRWPDFTLSGQSFRPSFHGFKNLPGSRKRGIIPRNRPTIAQRTPHLLILQRSQTSSPSPAAIFGHRFRKKNAIFPENPARTMSSSSIFLPSLFIPGSQELSLPVAALIRCFPGGNAPHPKRRD